MRNKTIIRIEHPDDGFGIWKSCSNGRTRIRSLPCYYEIKDHHENLPTLSEEGITRTNDLFCAFRNKRQFNLWINEWWIPELIDLGFKIFELEVSNIIVGDYQVAYRKEDIISKKDITSTFLVLQTI